MDTRASIYDYKGPVVNQVQFNDTQSHFAVALDDGFAIFSSETGSLHSKYGTKSRIRLAVMLGTSQIVGLVQQGQTNQGLKRFILWDTEKAREVASISSDEPIIGARLTKHHIALVLEREVLLYRHQPQLEKVASYATGSNSSGLCCLGQSTLAIPGRIAGQIRIFELDTQRVNIVPAHMSPLKALALSPDETLLASASEKGTLIRLHSVSSCARVGELRRGLSPAIIYSLAISPSSNHLVVTSDTNTLHIFKLPQYNDQDHHPDLPSQNNVQKWASLAWLPFAPKVFSDVYSFASTVFDPGKEREAEFPASGDAGRSPKGVAGWIDDQTLCIVNAGSDARYERFAILRNSGGVSCVRAGWSRFMQPI